jgi:ABC-type polysaccharide/polyol phosphate transport system ATPase subunit
VASPDTTTPADNDHPHTNTNTHPPHHHHTLKERALHPFRRAGHDTLRALRDVSVTIEPGEFFGIVGRNGSGKSTLLKCLAGIYAVDDGRIFVNGRLSAFIELGVGFNPDLAARDNVMLNATMLGLSPREARRRFDAIIVFAELHDFVDLKIKNYSSGMLVRLAFAVMIQVDADILLIDEVLAVGDANFQQKCFDEFERIREAGKTVLLVTHDMGSVRRFCTRAMLLEKGRTVAIGDPEAVGSKYLEMNFSEQARADHAREAGDGDEVPTPRILARQDDPERYGSGEAEILSAWFEDETGTRTDMIKTAYHVTFAAKVRFHQRVENPRFTVDFQNAHRVHVFQATTALKEPHTGVFEAGDVVLFRVFFPNFLGPDRYRATVSVELPGGGWLDRRERMLSFVVSATEQTGALVQSPYEVGVHAWAEDDAEAQIAIQRRASQT